VRLRSFLCVAAQVLSVVLPSQIIAVDRQAETALKQSACDIGYTRELCEKGLPVAPEKELPFRLSDGYLILVEGQIGTQTNLKFLLDTGATISIVDSKIANKLKLKREPRESFNFDRKLGWEQAPFPEIQFGPIKATNIVMLVGHLAEYSEFGRNVDAIIGLDLLKLSNFSIDYATRKIIFHSFRQETVVNPKEPLSDCCLILELKVQGHAVRLIVDTGLQGILLFEERLLTTVPELRITEYVKVTMGERLHARKTTLKDVVIGPTIRDVSVLLTKAPAPEMLPGICGVVGIAALNARRVNFDFVNGTLSWE
jgi:predicted aspartyl protease